MLSAPIKLKALPFAPGEARITGGPFLHAQEMGRQYLLNLDPDRLLAPFYEAAGLKPQKARYGGWESMQISGHMLGHWLSGAAWMHKAAGDGELKRRLDRVVRELAAIQARDPGGFVGGFGEGPFKKVFSGQFEVQNFSLAGHWVPWYTMHKLFAGLLDAHEIAGNGQALVVARRLADWADQGLGRLGEADFQRMLGCEHGGMSESLAELSARTGEQKYLALARRFAHHAVLDPLAEGRDELAGRHANTQIPKLAGAARVYELTGDPYFGKAAGFFWKEVASRRSYAFGGNSIGEHFPELGTEPLGPNTAETCNTYNMLRLTRRLFNWEAGAEMGDFIERALLNHILASQDPDSGMMLYFLSTKPGHFKVYSSPFDSMWCCTGTGLENPGRYAESAYFHAGSTLWINLYMATELHWQEKGLKLRQATEFPEEELIRLDILAAPDEKLELKFRVPYWVSGEMLVKVNGKPSGKAGAGKGWLGVKRGWAAGDRVEIKLPMGLHLQKSADDPTQAAVLYGPLVLAADMGTEGMPASDQYKDQNEPGGLPAPAQPAFVSARGVASWLKPVAGKPLRFRSESAGKPADFDFIPLYRLHHRRYSIYNRVLNPPQWKARQRRIELEEKERRELDARSVDWVEIGRQQSELEHQFKGKKTQSGAANGGNWRHAEEGGWFSYQLKVDPSAANILRATYWGGDSGRREFEVLAGGVKIADQSLSKPGKPGFLDMEYQLPLELTRGRQRLEIRFQPKPGNMAGGAYGLRILRHKN